MSEVRQIITQELLEAFVDGELDAATQARIDATLARNAHIARRVARIHALRGMLRAHLSSVLDEPVPPRLLAAAAGGSVWKRTWRTLRWIVAVGAGLAIGAALGRLIGP